MVMSLSRVLWKVHSKAPTVTASMLGTVLAAGEGYTTIRDSTGRGPGLPRMDAPSTIHLFLLRNIDTAKLRHGPDGLNRTSGRTPVADERTL